MLSHMLSKFSAHVAAAPDSSLSNPLAGSAGIRKGVKRDQARHNSAAFKPKINKSIPFLLLPLAHRRAGITLSYCSI
jgi:hypothetical protein